LISLLADHAPLYPTLRAPVAADTGYLRRSWCEGYKQSPEAHRLSWRLYKQHVEPMLFDALGRADTRVVVADLDGAIVGWIAYSPGRRTSTVHWVHTRFEAPDTEEPLRRRGVMSRLVDAAQLGARVVYTHRGPYPRHRGCGETSDRWISRWMLGRGQFASYVPYEEWKR
jgi:hypothetical protein